VLVVAIVRTSEHRDDDGAGGHDAHRCAPVAATFHRRGDSERWPEFERAFADYVRAGGDRRS
jgi:hypothetical protein